MRLRKQPPVSPSYSLDTVDKETAQGGPVDAEHESGKPEEGSDTAPALVQDSPEERPTNESPPTEPEPGTDSVPPPPPPHEVARKPKGLREPRNPTPMDVEEHLLTHFPYAHWCEVCVAGRRPNVPHKVRKEEPRALPLIHADYCFSESLQR